MRFFLVGLLIWACLGCGSSGPELAPVTGTVSIDGTPLKKGTIVFESEGNRPANGRIEDGKIVEVTTFNKGDGVPVGSHKVAVFALEETSTVETSDPSQPTATGSNYMGTGKSLIPDKYNNPDTSGLTAEVEAGQENMVTYELKSGE